MYQSAALDTMALCATAHTAFVGWSHARMAALALSLEGFHVTLATTALVFQAILATIARLSVQQIALNARLMA